MLKDGWKSCSNISNLTWGKHERITGIKLFVYRNTNSPDKENGPFRGPAVVYRYL